ncbi:hypothetical protein E2C01_067466 [Portunus trituberculatus]|uniref:Uncharacterized protein n=1 Tax=Portunus trituberculatus TaxID=210409 RepID=A0A5B7HV44_PORTR|nr:hypothetical protein [Portunus trituberculatus]
MTKRHRGSAETLDLVQVSPGAHNRKSSRDRSTRVAPIVSVQPPVTPFGSDRASCDENGLCMETSVILSQLSLVDPLYRKVQSCLILVLRGPVGMMIVRSRKAAVQRPGTSQLPVSSRRLIISSQVSHGQPIQKARPSSTPK